MMLVIVVVEGLSLLWWMKMKHFLRKYILPFFLLYIRMRKNEIT